MAGRPGSEPGEVKDQIVIEYSSRSLVPSGSARGDISDQLHETLLPLICVKVVLHLTIIQSSATYNEC
jgi:hypothetical protein